MSKERFALAPDIRDSTGPVDPARIDQLERDLGTSLPPAYRTFLATHNRCRPEPDSFSFLDGTDGSCVDRFLGIDGGVHSNLDRYLATYRDRIPKDLLPIAHDPGGNLVLIGLSGECLGKVYFWDHEWEADGYEPDMSNVHLVAKSFDDFLEGLFEIEIDA